MSGFPSSGGSSFTPSALSKKLHTSPFMAQVKLFPMLGDAYALVKIETIQLSNNSNPKIVKVRWKFND
jgi:hypothetical protein